MDGPDHAVVPAGLVPGSRRRRTLQTLASLAIAAALLVGVLPQLADLGEVWRTVRDLQAFEIGGLVVASAWNIATYLFVMMAALPGLGLRRAFIAGQLSTAVTNTVPAGSVLGVGVTYAVLASFGHGAAAIALAAVLSGFWNTFVKLGLPVVALAIVALEGDVNPALTSAALGGVAILAGAVGVLVAAVASERLARFFGGAGERVVNWVRGRLKRRPVAGWADRFGRFREDSAGLLRRRWHWLTAATIVSHLSLFIVLWVALRAVDVPPGDITWAEALGAFAIVRLATAVPITPGGIGIVEVGMTAALVVAGGEEEAVVAAVLIYRTLTYLLQIPLGAVSWVAWRREEARAAPA